MNAEITSCWHDEGAARELLGHRCWPDGIVCLRCGNEVAGLADGRWRCRSCRYTFGLFTGRWLARSGFSARKWLCLTDLFAREYPLRKISSRLNVAYNTAYKGVSIIRQALSAAPPCPLDPSFLTARPVEATRPPVFGIQISPGGYHCVPVPDLPVQSMWEMGLACSRCGNVVITSAFQQYTHLVFCATPALCRMCEHRLEDIPVYNWGSSPFWDFVCPRLARFHGITPERFPLYLKEMEWRWNTGIVQRFFDRALAALCRRVKGPR